MRFAIVTLYSNYSLGSGRPYLNGMRVLVRRPMMQRAREVAAGSNTAGFVTGYRGRPLGLSLIHI